MRTNDSASNNSNRSYDMFKKTVFALLAALVLTVSHGSAQAQTHGCVSNNMEEGAASAYPAWHGCNR